MLNLIEKDSLDVSPLIVCWVVTVSTFSMFCTEKGFHVPILIQLFSFYKSLSEIWIGNVESAETDHISITWLNLCDSGLMIKLLVGNHDALEMRSQNFANVRNLFLWGLWIFLFAHVYLGGFSDFEETNWSFAEFLA